MMFQLFTSNTSMYKVHLHAGAIKIIVWFCVCWGDYLRDKTHELSSRTYAQTIQ